LKIRNLAKKVFLVPPYPNAHLSRDISSFCFLSSTKMYRDKTDPRSVIRSHCSSRLVNNLIRDPLPSSAVHDPVIPSGAPLTAMFMYLRIAMLLDQSFTWAKFLE
jgi:hypothetical protein